jgi:site-specific recombinase XerD
MKMRPSSATGAPHPPEFPDAACLAALRAWYAGLTTRAAVTRYLPDHKAAGQSARGILGRTRRQLIAFARSRQRADLAALFEHSLAERFEQAKVVTYAIEVLRVAPTPEPRISDDIGLWLSARAVAALRAHGIDTLSELTVRIPRRRRWWSAIPRLGPASARQVEAFFAAHPLLTERAHALIVVPRPAVVMPWERLRLPHEVDGSHGSFRAPRQTCTLKASNDYDAVQAWLSLHESAATQRAYRKEAERLILWAIVERGCAMSSLTTDDAIAYRGFLRRPAPRERWIGPSRPRSSSEWRPFVRELSARSTAYALSVLGALFRWLIAQRYVLANPFAGIKVRGHTRATAMDASRGFAESEWLLVRTLADGLEHTNGWEVPAAQRLRFMLDFAYATGLRASELVGATLGGIQTDAHGDQWLHLVGKGGKAGKVALPPLARGALDRYLIQRRLPVTPARWNPLTPLIGSLEQDSVAGITGSRLWSIMKRFFAQAADVIQVDSPAIADKLRRASPHWTRHYVPFRIMSCNRVMARFSGQAGDAG